MINTSETRIIFNGTGVATDFPYSFKIINDTDVKVMTVDPDGTETVLDSDYYVDVTASKVIYPGYPPGEEPAESERPPVLPTGWQLVVYRDIPITQEANLGNVWPFNVIEDALDKITMILQNIYDGFKRSFKVSQSAPADIDIYVPIEANKALKWNANGTQIVTTVDPADVLPQAQNLLQQTTEQANIATNKANAAAESALSAADSEVNAETAMEQARAWAESLTSPDNQTDNDSPTRQTMSSKKWALLAKEYAETASSTAIPLIVIDSILEGKAGEPSDYEALEYISAIDEKEGLIIITDGKSAIKEIQVVKTVNNKKPINGNCNVEGGNVDTITENDINDLL